MKVKSMKIDDLKQRLRKQISKMGYPLEIEVQSILEERNWAVFPNKFFMDCQENKPREIDLFAFHGPTVSSRHTEPIAFAPHLIIECKKSLDYSLVLFSRNITAFTFYDFSGHMFDFPILLKEITEFRNPLKEFNLQYFLIHQDLHYKRSRKVSTNYPLVKPEGKEKRDLYDAVMKLVKAQAFEVEEALRRSPTITHTHHPLFFSFLAVVFEGQMFEALVDKGDVVLNELDHGLISVSFQPDYSDTPLHYVIDVVKKEHFKDFLVEIENDISTWVHQIKSQMKNIEPYLKRGKVENS